MDKTDQLHKLGEIPTILNNLFVQMYIPDETVCIDETMMPWRGRLGFHQYIPSKRHKYGVKFFKLCLPHGYTHKFKIYCGAENTGEDSEVPTSVSEQVVMNLCENILDTSRSLYTDNFYTSVTLAQSLLKRKTHLVGTLRKNRINNPKAVTKAKLKKGEIFSFYFLLKFYRSAKTFFCMHYR